MWDVWIHILGIWVECACWEAGGPVCRPYGGDAASPGGASGRPRPTKGAAGAQCAPLHGEGAGTCPLILPSVRTGAPSPQGEGLGKTKRDRSGTCPLKRRGEAELRRKFFWFLFFQEKELLTFFFKESRQLGKVLYEMQENFAEISTFLTGGTVAKAGRLW